MPQSATARAATQDNAATLGKGTLLSRVLGFLRDMLIAALVGGGGAADAFLLVFRIPTAARQLTAEGAFAYALMPAYAEQKRSGQNNAWLYLRSVSLALFLLLGILALCGTVFASPLALALAPGFADSPEIRALTASFLAICLMTLPLAAGAAASSAALMAEGDFRPPAYASALFNTVIIFSAGIAFALYGTGSVNAPYLLCWGVVAAGAAQWFYQTRALCSAGFKPLGPVALFAPATVRSIRALPGSVLGVGGFQANVFAAAFLASFLAEGSVSALYFAERLTAFPLGIVGASVGLAALADLSALAPGNAGGVHKTGGIDEIGLPNDDAKKQLFAERLQEAGRAALFFALPAAVGAACLAEPLTALIFGRGAFGPAETARTSAALLAYMAGLPALAFARPLLAAFGALRDTKTPLKAAAAGLCVTLCAGGALLATNVSWTPALAVSLGAYANAAVLLHALRKRGIAALPSLPWSARLLAANAVMAVCAAGCAAYFSANAAKACAVPLGIAVYFVAARALRIEEHALMARFAGKPFRGKG